MHPAGTPNPARTAARPAALEVPSGYERFDPLRPFPVFCESAFHFSVMRELHRCATAEEVWDLFERDHGAYPVLQPLLERANVGEHGEHVGEPYSYKTCNKYFGTMRKLNPLIDILWREAGRKPAKRTLSDAFVLAVAQHAVAVRIDERGLSDLGLRVYLASCALGSGTGGTVDIADARAASKADLFPGRGVEAFARQRPRASHPRRVRDHDAEDAVRPASAHPSPQPLPIYGAPYAPGRDGRRVVNSVAEPAAFPAFVRADASFAPHDSLAAGPFTRDVLAARRERASRAPRVLLLPAAARDAVRSSAVFTLARDHDLFGRVCVFEQQVRGTSRPIEMVVRRVVQNDYRGFFLMGIALDERRDEHGVRIMRLRSLPVRPTSVRWMDAGPRIAELPCEERDRIEELGAALDARLAVAVGAVTDVPLSVDVVLREDMPCDAMERLAKVRRDQVDQTARALGLTPAAARLRYGQCTVRRDRARTATHSRVLHDVVAGRNELLPILRAHADEVLDVHATYVLCKDDPERMLEGAGYEYLFAWEGVRPGHEPRLLGLGGSAVAVLQAYARDDARRFQERGGEPFSRLPDVAPHLRVHEQGSPQEWVEVVMGETSVVAVPLAPSMAKRRADALRVREERADDER